MLQALGFLAAAAGAVATPVDPDLEGMPGLPSETSTNEAPPPEVGAATLPEPTRSGPSDARFGGAFATRIDGDLKDDGAGEDVLETRQRLDLELAARLSPSMNALLSARLWHEARTPDLAFDGGRYGATAELREARLSWQGDGVGLDVGQLFMRWGVADAASPNDVLNPQDFRDPAPVAFEAPVVPIAAARLTATPGDLAFELDVVPFFEGHRATLFGTDWAPTGGDPTFAGLTESLRLLFSDAAQEDIQSVLAAPQPPDESPRNVSVGTRLGWSGSGVDLHVNASHGWDRIPELRFDPDIAAFLAAVRDGDQNTIFTLYPSVQPKLEAGEALLSNRYHRLTVVGADGAFAAGDFLLKAEAAYSFTRTLYRADFTPVRTAALSWAAGFDWLPDPDVTLTLECFGLRPDTDADLLFLGDGLINLNGHLSVAILTDRLFVELTGQLGLTQEDWTAAPALRWQPADGHALAGGVYMLGGPRGTVGGLFEHNDAGWMRYTLAF